MTEVIALFALSIPTAYELWNEKKGELAKTKWLSMTLRMIIAIVGVVVAAGFHYGDFKVNLLRCALMVFAIFFAFFNYVINKLLGREPWYSYLSNSPIDRFLNKWKWQHRMLVASILLIVSNVIYWI